MVELGLTIGAARKERHTTRTQRFVNQQRTDTIILYTLWELLQKRYEHLWIWPVCCNDNTSIELWTLIVLKQYIAMVHWYYAAYNLVCYLNFTLGKYIYRSRCLLSLFFRRKIYIRVGNTSPVDVQCLRAVDLDTPAPTPIPNLTPHIFSFRKSLVRITR